jgi:hypothetical protein
MKTDCVLALSSPDKPGLVATAASSLAANGGNL